MSSETKSFDRRTFVTLAGVAAVGALVCEGKLEAQSGAAVSLFDGRTLDGWIDLEKNDTAAGWIVKDGVMASTGTGRGVIYTAKDYRRYRLTFTMRHVSGAPDHQACVLIFCTRPSGEDKPLGALGGIQFQVPNGGHWDYRPGMNTAGGPESAPGAASKFSPTRPGEPPEWPSRSHPEARPSKSLTSRTRRRAR
jgi:hypothetical protein